MGIRYAHEPVTRALMEEAMPLVERQYAEVFHPCLPPLNMQIDVYEQVVALGMYHAFTARTETGELVGYASFFVQPMPQFGGVKSALEDGVYVHKGLRGRNIGGDLIDFAEGAFAAMGIEWVYQHAPEGHKFGSLLKHKGYAPVYTLHGKRLKKSGGE